MSTDYNDNEASEDLKELAEWVGYVKSLKLPKEKEKFIIGHPWMAKEYKEFIKSKEAKR